MINPKDRRNISSSFRDPSGFLFYREGLIYRQVNTSYKENYDYLINSGLYKILVDAKLLIPHEEIDDDFAKHDDAYKVIKPELIKFISYPYEWCFSQLKDAALVTLEVQKKSIEFGMTLKDCSAYNIQFRKGRPVFIDTLSFERYIEGKPWIAYRQFCRHFLGPLTLMCYSDARLNRLFRVFIDGVPLDLTSSLLPFHTFLKFSLLLHIHLHAKSQRYFFHKQLHRDKMRNKVSRLSLLGLIENLESAVKKLKWQPQDTGWANYYENTSYSHDALDHKREIVAEFLEEINPKNIWDIGANVGLFSRIASDREIETISFDADHLVVEKNYLECVAKDERHILPLLLDLTNPTPAIGWQNQERKSLIERGPADTVLALALIHHLVVSNNLPLGAIAEFFNKICNTLIIEFIPKDDAQVHRLLLSREDAFLNYTKKCFENEFNKYFTIKESIKIKNSEREMYLMTKKTA